MSLTMNMLLPPVGFIMACVDEAIKIMNMKPLERMWYDVEHIESSINYFYFIVEPVAP